MSGSAQAGNLSKRGFSMSSKFCSYCGATLSRPDATFCTKCGRSLAPSVSPSPPLPPPGSTQPRLMVQQPGRSANTHPLTKNVITIGRGSQNDVVIDANVVSRRHAQITQQGSDYWITDTGSTNGVAINGRRIPAHQPIKLDDGALLRIGDQFGNSVAMTFQLTAQQQTAVPGKTIRLGELNLDNLSAYTLGRDPSNPVQLNHFSVSRRHAEIQRTPQGDVIRDLGSVNGTYVNGNRLTKPHLFQAGDIVQIGSFKLVYDKAGFTQYAPDGNYRLDATNLTRIVSIGGLGKKLSGGSTQKVILNDVTLSIYPREFVALVGGSGAGKSTLMKAMSGFTPANSGQVLVNGDDLYANFAAYRSILGYVPQDDIIHGPLTVNSALRYAAQLRLPDAPPEEIEGRIQKVIEEVELVGHEEKQVQRLSGGQRKRVSIAVELLAEPGLFFLDEPTSGLDPGLEKKMMYTMRDLADKGRTIVLVTHATANIDQCTQVAFMAESKLAYFGPPNDALAFFKANDFSDIYTTLSQPVDPNNLPPACLHHYQQMQATTDPQNPPQAAAVWAEYYRHSPDYQQHVGRRLQSNTGFPQLPTHQQQSQPQTQSEQMVSQGKQFSVLAQRYFELIRRDWQSLVVLIAVMPIIGLLLLFMADKYDLVGKNESEIRQEIQEAIREKQADEDHRDDNEQFQGIYQVVGSTQRVLFIMALAGSLLGLFAASYEIVKEEPIYQRERMVNLKIGPYLLSKMLVLAGFALIQAFLFLLVLRMKIEFPDEGVFLPAGIEMYITLVLTALASMALGLLISALVTSDSTVIYVVLVVLFVQILFAGAIFEIPNVAKPVSYLTTTRWALEALGSTADMEALKAKGGGCLESEKELPPGMPPPEATDYCKEGQTELGSEYEFHVSYKHEVPHLWSRWFVLFGFMALFLGLTAVLQKRKDVV